MDYSLLWHPSLALLVVAEGLLLWYVWKLGEPKGPRPA